MSTYYVAGIPFDSDNSLSHHGVKGQKWGIRRYQNPDGTLTEEGKARYLEYPNRMGESHYTLMEKGIKRDISDKNKSKLKSIFEEHKEKSGYNQAANNRRVANDERRKHTFLEVLNPNNKYTKAFKESDKTLQDTYEKFVVSSSVDMDKYIRTLPKDKRMAAESYVYQLFGWDW